MNNYQVGTIFFGIITGAAIISNEMRFIALGAAGAILIPLLLPPDKRSKP